MKSPLHDHILQSHFARMNSTNSREIAVLFPRLIDEDLQQGCRHPMLHVFNNDDLVGEIASYGCNFGPLFATFDYSAKRIQQIFYRDLVPVIAANLREFCVLNQDYFSKEIIMSFDYWSYIKWVINQMLRNSHNFDITQDIQNAKINLSTMILARTRLFEDDPRGRPETESLFNYPGCHEMLELMLIHYQAIRIEETFRLQHPSNVSQR